MPIKDPASKRIAHKKLLKVRKLKSKSSIGIKINFTASKLMQEDLRDEALKVMQNDHLKKAFDRKLRIQNRSPDVSPDDPR